MQPLTHHEIIGIVEPFTRRGRHVDLSASNRLERCLVLKPVAIEEADRHRPDIAVVLTDLDGPARFRPRWPVIWAVPEPCATAVAPFGRKLSLR